MPILSPTYSASSRECVVNTIILFFLYCFKKSQNLFVDSISIPLLGSSNKIIGELLINAKAVHNFLLSPPDKQLHK